MTEEAAGLKDGTLTTEQIVAEKTLAGAWLMLTEMFYELGYKALSLPSGDAKRALENAAILLKQKSDEIAEMGDPFIGPDAWLSAFDALTQFKARFAGDSEHYLENIRRCLYDKHHRRRRWLEIVLEGLDSSLDSFLRTPVTDADGREWQLPTRAAMYQWKNDPDFTLKPVQREKFKKVLQLRLPADRQHLIESMPD